MGVHNRTHGCLYTHFVGLIEIPGSTGCHSLPSGDAA